MDMPGGAASTWSYLNFLDVYRVAFVSTVAMQQQDATVSRSNLNITSELDINSNYFNRPLLQGRILQRSYKAD